MFDKQMFVQPELTIACKPEINVHSYLMPLYQRLAWFGRSTITLTILSMLRATVMSYL